MSDSITYAPASTTPHLHNWLTPGGAGGDRAAFACDACGVHDENRGEYEDMERWIAGLYADHGDCV